MKTLLVTTPRSAMDSKTVYKPFPDKLEGWRIKELPSDSLSQTAISPDVTLVRLNTATRSEDLKAMMPGLVHIQIQAPGKSHVLFSVIADEPESHFQSRVYDQVNKQLHAFPDPELVDVTFAQTASEMEAQLAHIACKLDLPRKTPAADFSRAVPRSSPLDKAKEIINATKDLRAASGNLSSTAVAQAFGVSVTQLAAWLGRSRQALHQTPDADSFQDALGFFERVARLRTVLPKGAFLKWLRMPNAELDNKKPLELLASGEGQIPADLVDDMLTGAPA